MANVVLCAVDLSSVAEEAIRQARELEASVGAELVVYHAFETQPFVTAEMPEATLELIERSRNSARESLEQTIARLPGVGVTATVRIEVEPTFGGVPAAILAKADALHASLIVVGTRAARGLERLLLGNVAKEVVRHARCPVLVARPSPAGARVLAGTDLSRVSMAAVLTAAREAWRWRLELLVVHCLDLPPEVMALGEPVVPLPPEHPDSRPARRERAHREVEAWLKSAHVRAEVVIADGAPVPELVRLAEELPARLVAVGTTGKTGLKRLLLGSVAEGVTNKAPCSVLAVRLDERGEALRGVHDEGQPHEPEIEPLDGGLLHVPEDIPETEEQRLERIAAAEEHEERVREGVHLGKI